MGERGRGEYREGGREVGGGRGRRFGREGMEGDLRFYLLRRGGRGYAKRFIVCCV